MKKNQPWSALLIGIFVTMIIIVIAVYLLEKIVPFARDIKGVENGNVSYYRANTALNEALLSMSGSDPSISAVWVGPLSNWSGSKYTIIANGTTLPQPGLWNSEYDPDWAILAPGKPVQLVLKSNGPINWTNTIFNFRVPDLDKDNTTPEILSGSTIHPIINWTLTTSGETLQASGSQVMANMASSGTVSFDTQNWLTLSGSSENFSTFYISNCNTSPQVCTLKLSLVNPLLLNDNITVAPYLEYQAHFDQAIPLQTAVVETQGYAGGFRKNITRFIQQMTTNEALDFTVFQ